MAEKELSILVRAKNAAAAARDIGKVDTAVGKLGTSAARGFKGATTTIGSFAKKTETALGNARRRITGFASSIGPLLGVGGLLGLTSLLTSSINEAANFGKNVANVAKITGLGTAAASAMVDTLDKWGVSSDRLIPMLGKLEKNVGTIGGTTKKATAFQKEYGVSILNGKGHIADANTLLLRSADYFNSHASASKKATFMSKLWGKSWQDMIPILSKGSKFIQAQEADSIHLTQTQLDNITKFRSAQRDFQDTFGDVQVKIGAELMPVFTEAMKAMSSWLDTNGDKVAAFFHDAASFAGKAAGNVGDIFNALKSGWGTVPEPLRDFLLKGVIADRTVKFLFGVSPIKLVTSVAAGGLGKALGGILGGFGQRGSSPANPLFVVAEGGLPGGLPGLPGALPAAGSIVGDIAAAFATIGIGGVAGLIIAPASIAAIGLAITQASDPEGKRQLAGRQQTAAARGLNPNNVSRDRGAGAPGSINVFDGWVKAQKAATGELEETASQLRKIKHDLGRVLTPKQAKRVIKEGAQRDRDTSAGIAAAIRHNNAVAAAQNSAEGASQRRNSAGSPFGGRDTAKRVGFVPSVKLDASQVRDIRNLTPVQTAVDKASTAIETMRGRIGDAIARDTQAAATGAASVRSQVSSSGSSGVAATYGAAGQITSAIRAIPAPIVNVNVSATTITRTTTISKRAGPTGGSRDGSRDGDGGNGPGQG